PELSGDELVRVFLDYGCQVVACTEAKWRLTRGGQEIVVPRERRLAGSVVATLATEANIGPLALLSALERGAMRGMLSVAGPPLRERLVSANDGHPRAVTVGHAGEPMAVPASWTRRRPGRILVIDDELPFGRAIQAALGHEHLVTTVTQARAALALLTAGERYDLVLYNFRMPDMDGVAFHRALGAIVPEEASRIVFVTGHLPSGSSFVRNGPPNLWLEKPVDMKALAALVEQRLTGAPDAEKHPRIA
ncbi:MAG: response regulator, partial [Polyangiaceae bacterium]|nr:response regulator [Polyangiaceae bacterium]